MFCERTVRGDSNHIFWRIFFQFLGTSSPAQNPSRNGVQYFISNVETEPAGIYWGAWGGRRESRGRGNRTSVPRPKDLLRVSSLILITASQFLDLRYLAFLSAEVWLPQVLLRYRNFMESINTYVCESWSYHSPQQRLTVLMSSVKWRRVIW